MTVNSNFWLWSQQNVLSRTKILAPLYLKQFFITKIMFDGQWMLRTHYSTSLMSKKCYQVSNLLSTTETRGALRSDSKSLVLYNLAFFEIEGFWFLNLITIFYQFRKHKLGRQTQSSTRFGAGTLFNYRYCYWNCCYYTKSGWIASLWRCIELV